jgi:SAM-dependent methyltransferase
MGERVAHRAGDALQDDLGEAAYDLVLVFSLVHHFDEPTNRELVRRAARALRPGGYLVIGDAIRPSAPGKGGQQGAFFDLYFALTSRSGLWSVEEMRDWQTEAGLVVRKPISLVPGGGFALQVAERAA